MSYFLSTTLSFLLLYKYVALFIVTYLASLLLPLPSDTALLASGAFASQGFLNISEVLLIALSASIIGDLTGFIVSRLYGREFLMKIGLKRLIMSKKFINLEKFIAKNYGPTIVITRFVGQLGPWVNILIGLSKMSFKKFLVYDLIGNIVDILVIGLAGYFLGSAWQNWTVIMEFTSLILIVVILAFIFSRMYFKKISD